MGYVPPPPPRPPGVRIPQGAPRMGRKRRNRIESVPRSTSIGILKQKIGVGMEVEALDPHGERWEWRTFYTFDGHRSLIGYEYSSWRKPSPYEVCGRTTDEGKAWDAAREAADDARARWTAEQIRYSRKSEDHVPL